MNPKQFLTLGGIILVLVAVLGYVGIIGPTADQSIFGGAWYFDNAENVAHLVLGVVALIAAFALGASVQKPLTIVVGVVALFFAVYNVFSTTFLSANLESPLDLLLHLVVCVWALYSGLNKKSAMMGAAM